MVRASRSTKTKSVVEADFPRPIVAVDVVLLTARAGELRCLLAERREARFEGHNVLPGACGRAEEALELAAARGLADKARVAGVFLEQLYTFGSPERDPRGRVIAVSYVALLSELVHPADAHHGTTWVRVHVPWAGETGGPVECLDASGRGPLPLGFDHADQIGMAIKRLRGRLGYSPIGFQLLPEKFTLRELQDAYEIILGTKLDKGNFRSILRKTDVVEKVDGYRDTGGRPARLYRFKDDAVAEIKARRLFP